MVNRELALNHFIYLIFFHLLNIISLQLLYFAKKQVWLKWQQVPTFGLVTIPLIYYVIHFCILYSLI